MSKDSPQPEDVAPSFGQPQAPPPQDVQPSVFGQARPPKYGQQQTQPPAYGQAQAPHHGQPPQYGQQQQYGQPQYGQPRLAEWFPRVGALLIDNILATFVLVIACFVMMASMVSSVSSLDSGGTPSTGLSVVAVVFLVVGYVVCIGVSIWNRYLRQGRTGQSVGKRVMKIRLISVETGQPVGAGTAFLRDLVHIADGAVCDLGYLWPLWDANKQTFADKACNTIVVAA